MPNIKKRIWLSKRRYWVNKLTIIRAKAQKEENMHSDIIELGYNPIKKDEWVEESSFYGDFVGTIADYVYDTKESDRIERIRYFVQTMGSEEIIIFDEKTESITFSESAIGIYFKNAYNEFMDLASSMTLSDFANSDLKPYKLSKLTERKYDYYIFMDGMYHTLDDFMRFIVEPNKSYYFGGVVGYHY